MNLKHNHWRIMHPALQQRVAAQPISQEIVLNNSICMAQTPTQTSIIFSAKYKMDFVKFFKATKLQLSLS
jgi:hypothetical protein